MRHNTSNINRNNFDVLRFILLVATFLYFITITTSVHAQNKNKYKYKCQYHLYNSHKGFNGYIHVLLDSNIVFSRTKNSSSYFAKLDTVSIKELKNITFKKTKNPIINPAKGVGIGVTTAVVILGKSSAVSAVAGTFGLLGGLIGVITNIGNKKNTIETIEINGNQTDYTNQLRNLNYYSIEQLNLENIIALRK